MKAIKFKKVVVRLFFTLLLITVAMGIVPPFENDIFELIVVLIIVGGGAFIAELLVNNLYDNLK